MHIFISAYVFLALASWSALAAPLPRSEHDNENIAAQKHSLSSILTGRQQLAGFGIGPVVLPQSTSDNSAMDCDSKPKSSKGDNNTDNYQTFETNLSPATTTGPKPAIARRSLRRGSNDSPSIFERDEAPTTAASGNPITVGDVLTYYLKQRSAERKHSPSPRTSRDFN